MRYSRLVLAALCVALGFGCNLPPMGAESAEAPGEGSAPTGAAPADSLLGSWQSGAETLEFRADGTLLINGAAATYQVMGQTLVVQSATGTVTFPFQLSAEQLVVTVDEVPVAYQRTSPMNTAPASDGMAASGNGAVPAYGTAPAAMPPPAAGAPATAPGAGGPPQGAAAALVGKWCYVANVHANDGGRATETCFVLNPDGTYQYHSETSSSGQYGGTASQTDDTGTWQATDTTLTAHSRTGQTFVYQLARQNHPKNNDPMLVVDGKAFVTFYQKPPW